MNSAGQIFGDLLIDIDDYVAFVVLDLLERHAADDAIAQGLDDLARFDNRSDVDAFEGSAILLGDDNVLGNVHQTAGQVTGVGGLQCRISQTLTSAVG